MDTVVEIQVDTEQSSEETGAAFERAFAAFHKVERACSRFDPDSELRKACRQIQIPVPVSPYLFEPLKFAMEMAEGTGGAFDPAVGKAMEENGFNRRYLTGELVESPSAASANYRDIVLDERNRTLTLLKPLVIDLGAVAKGFAIDLAANELKQFERFAVNAGGDLFAGGADERANAWSIGIQHPEQKDRVIHMIRVSNEAICTSGSYERKSAVKNGTHHIIDPKTKASPVDWISCSVVAPFAMLADAFSTTAFLLGADDGVAFIEQADLKGILITPDLQIVTVGGS